MLNLLKIVKFDFLVNIYDAMSFKRKINSSLPRQGITDESI